MLDSKKLSSDPKPQESVFLNPTAAELVGAEHTPTPLAKEAPSFQGALLSRYTDNFGRTASTMCLTN
jgi:hypothetical protein